MSGYQLGCFWMLSKLCSGQLTQRHKHLCGKISVVAFVGRSLLQNSYINIFSALWVFLASASCTNHTSHNLYLPQPLRSNDYSILCLYSHVCTFVLFSFVFVFVLLYLICICICVIYCKTCASHILSNSIIHSFLSAIEV